MFNINFADDWIWTADLCYWKWPLYQLSHNDFPLVTTCTIEYLWSWSCTENNPLEHYEMREASFDNVQFTFKNIPFGKHFLQ